MVFVSALLVFFTNYPIIASFPDLQPPYVDWHSSRKAVSNLQVDLGYGIYAGVANSSTGLNVFKGIRFAAPPTGPLRWQAPQPAPTNRDAVIDASSYGAACPHNLKAGQYTRVLPSPISEDCLFLNVKAPQNASDLPVFVNIHGGGYGVGDGREDLSRLINVNHNAFVGVSIQYRLGAFGFLASDEVHRNGVVNAGLLDQQFALQWVQDHISKFGGDPRKVTIFGISAGGGSAMLHDMAYGGTQGTSLFTNSISLSPYLPQQHNYNDWRPSQAYYALATHAGCPPTWAYGNSSQTIFQCLISKDTSTLQAAAAAVSNSGVYGTWAFTPVTDGDLLRSTPSSALSTTPLNGQYHRTSNCAEESFFYVPQTILTAEALTSWLQFLFPRFTTPNITTLLSHYPSQPLNITTHFATSGSSGATAVQTSATASGYQQLANLIYAESTFVCPSYWLAEAYNTDPPKKGYKMQYSIPIALHGYDGIAVFGNQRLQNQGDDFVAAMQRIIGDFVLKGEVEGLGTFEGPQWPMQNLNQTGGREVRVNSTIDVAISDLGGMWYVGPGLKNKFDVVDGYAWEAGRGERCKFWKGIGGRVPM